MSTGIAARAFAKMLREHPVTDMHRADCRGCGECCGRFLPLTPADKVRLMAYVRSHGMMLAISSTTSIFTESSFARWR